MVKLGSRIDLINLEYNYKSAAVRFREYKLTNQDLVSLDQLRHVFIYYGHSFRFGPYLKVKPSVLAKVVKGAPVEFDLNGVISLFDVIDLGANYRSGDGLGLLAGITPGHSHRRSRSGSW